MATERFGLETAKRVRGGARRIRWSPVFAVASPLSSPGPSCARTSTAATLGWTTGRCRRQRDARGCEARLLTRSASIGQEDRQAIALDRRGGGSRRRGRSVAMRVVVHCEIDLALPVTQRVARRRAMAPSMQRRRRLLDDRGEERGAHGGSRLRKKKVVWRLRLVLKNFFLEERPRRKK